MNKKHLDFEVVKILYLRYKEYLLPIIGIIVSLVVFFEFVLPQIENFLATKDTIAASEGTLAIMTQNYNETVSINDSELGHELDIASHALPSQKDFAGILKTISSAAGASGVILDDYSFQIGDINGANEIQKSAIPSVEVMLTIKADVTQTKNFLSALSQGLPLSQITNVSLTKGGITTITADFFYAPSKRVNFIETNPLPLLTQGQKAVLQNLDKQSKI